MFSLPTFAFGNRENELSNKTQKTPLISFDALSCMGYWDYETR